MQDLDAIVAEAVALFGRIDDADQLEQAKARYVGKSGALREAEKSLGRLPAAERPAFGSKLNAARQRIETALDESRERIQQHKLEARLTEEAIDVTLPGRGPGTGGVHPVNRTLQRIEQLFRTMGFTVV